jgi:hypothetical protein
MSERLCSAAVGATSITGSASHRNAMDGRGNAMVGFYNVNEENDMKKLLTTVTFLTVAATPAFAQSYDPDMGTGNIAPMIVSNQRGEGAYAQAPTNYGHGYPDSRSVHSNATQNLDYGSKMPRRSTNNN